jgi:hypothetical protein
MSLLRNFTIGYTTTLISIAAGTLIYIRNVEEVKAEEFPDDFKRLIYPNNRFGLFKLSTKTNQSLLQLSKALFNQPLYQLEYAISDTSYNQDFDMQIGQPIGNMTLEAMKSNNATFRYIAPGYNFRFYFQTDKNQLILGFVDYTDSVLEEWGSRIYVPLLLQGLCNQIN